ncbi:FxSxx-COOH cyclophane-containing RiPP peptide [Streptomyces sp. NPDC001843]|uniref:FxSxx-COOH cyclophane-containing RiPP peptide n=1 Tax=Streptomyces sp. NPDC001843 TaxID=3364617 RepID=UPI0036959BA6
MSVEPTEQVSEPVGDEPLPDVLSMNLAELRTVRHPVLREVLEDLRVRAARPGETLWGFNNSL